MIQIDCNFDKTFSSGCGRRRRPQIWRVAANILNKHAWTADKMWSYILEVGRGVKTPQHKGLACYEMLNMASDLDGF
jgi:hypothetical protein